MADAPKTPNALLHGALDGLILKVLSRGPSHGYAVARAIEDSTGLDVLNALGTDLQGLLEVGVDAGPVN